MMPQSNLFVSAPLRRDREADLRGLLASMNKAPGIVDPRNMLVPFATFDRLHFARFVILRDETLEDIHTAYGLPPHDYPVKLAFIADFDGSVDDFRAELARRAGDGLRRVFSCCEGFPPDADLAAWMQDHEQPAAAAYVNWRGRTARDIREEDALRVALEAHLQDNQALFEHRNPKEVHKLLKGFVYHETHAGRLMLSREEPTPLGWRLRNLIHLIGVPLLLLLASPFLLLYLPMFIYQLRRREKNDPEIAPRPTADHETSLATVEDHEVTNQFTVMGGIKPGLFRSWTMRFLLWLVNYSARHVFIHGHLGRVSTIHFARWVYVDGGDRMVFVSNYDGSLESYMDDFINKVGWGLNLAFSNGISYPITNWLVLEGSKDEQKFKYVLRRHQLPTQVWYNAHPGLSAFDLKRNRMIRDGIERDQMSQTELRQWVQLL